MDKIVNKSLKIDLHIHSEKSSFKDKDIVKNSNINNISTLIEALKFYKINLCAITDHDSFDYELYSKLKEEEKKDNCIKKVLPGVEFSITFQRKEKVKPLHVIAIFDDEDDEKVKMIEEILKFNVDKKPDYNLNETFSESEFLNILSKIDLDTLLIVHQKQTVSSTSKPKQNDANSLGEEAFNEFILSEYFEAYEFKNRKNEVFNNIEKQNYKNDALLFITGSDCHEWDVYPRHDSKSVDVEFKHTFIKSLPSFRGLAFALTDDSRISLNDNFYTTDSDNYIDEIKLNLNDVEMSVPLSRGLNAIIGDNSIGKSLLLHKLTKYYRLSIEPTLSPLTRTIVDAYEGYLDENNISIDTFLTQNMIFGFDTQGEIRKKFNQGALKSKTFFETKYPLDIDVSDIKNKVIKIVDDVVQTIDNKFMYDNSYESISNIDLLKEEINPTSISIINCDENIYNEQLSDINNIINARNNVINALNDLVKLQITLLEKTQIDELIKLLTTENNKSLKHKNNLDVQNKIINSINKAFNIINDEKNKVNTCDDTTYSKYVNNVQMLAQQISMSIKYKNKIKEIKYDIDEYVIPINEKPYLNYTFVKKTKIAKIEKSYINNLLCLPLKKNHSIFNIKELNRDSFISMLNKYDEGEYNNPIDFYKQKILLEIDKDLKNIPSIVQFEDNNRKDYSDGVNAHVYFDIISSNVYQKGIYLIDQPEDDVSPSAIKKYLLDDFKRMSKDRQILLITHNPQFVVNLDVDNVICITKNKDKKIEIVNGALEYKDSEVDIIQSVAEILEGGIDSIRKRWKRYDKNNN